MAYNLETVLSEKLETILSRSTTNTRKHDYYDVNILTTLRAQDMLLFTDEIKRNASMPRNLM